MSFSFSQPQTSSFLAPNELLDLERLRLAPQEAADVHQNRMLEQQTAQQQLTGNDIALTGAAFAPLLGMSEEEAAKTYQAVLPGLQQRGIGKYAPAAYPGHAATQALVQRAMSVKDQLALQQNQAGWGQITGDGTGTTSTGGGGGGSTGTVGGADTAPINAAGDSRTRKAAEGGPPAAGSPGAAVAKQVHDFWISKGFSEEQTAGIMAGGPGSESDFTPTVFGDKGTSYGLYQHHGPRLDAMRQFFGLSGSQNPTADQQNQYAHWEITQGPLKNVGEMLKNAKTPAEAAAIWTQYFGVPADKSEIGRRAAGAQRFVGLYGQPQQGGPGGATAPGVVTGDVARPGDVPPPPGGAPGAYGGGGMGAVIGGQPNAVRATIPAGRPTGPPVITDQPAGSGVVAGPPGTAVVGAPQPPGPAVPGDVAAINAGIAGRGGAPATDPNVTPTPARYAGTAAAPSVEAAPQPGWGTGIGSGYGPQNTLAPTPPAPTQPAAPVVAQQQPSAPAQPAARPATPAAGGLLAGLSPDQVQAVQALRRSNGTPAQGLAMIEHFKEVNATAAHQTLEEQRQAAADKAAAAEREYQHTKDTDIARRAQAKEDREAVAANRPFQGNTADAQNRNILIEGTNSGKTGTTEYQSAYADYAAEKHTESGLSYKPDMSPYATPTGKVYGDSRGGRDLGKMDASQGPLAPPAINTAMMGNVAGLRNIDRALRELNAHPDSVGAKGLQPDWMIQRTDPEGVALRAEISDILSQTFHDRSGAAVMVSEAGRMKPFTPTQTDTAVALRTKLERMRNIYLGTLYDHYSTYGPEGGGRALPRVEAVLKGYSPDEPSATQPLKNTKIKVDANGNVIP